MEELEQILKAVGVKVKRFGRYKSFNRVLKEISKRWNKLTRDQQDKISKAMAGSKKEAEFSVSQDIYNK